MNVEEKSKMKNAEIADLILGHMASIEKRGGKHPKSQRLFFYSPNCYATSKAIYIRSIDYQYDIKVTKVQAIEYLEWLEQGNIGTYYMMVNIKEKER